MSVQVRVQRAGLALRELLPESKHILPVDVWVACDVAKMLLERWQYEQQRAAVAETEDPFGNTR